MLLLGRKSASEKVASFLGERAERLVEPGCHADFMPKVRTLTLPFSRQQIADVIAYMATLK